MKLTLTLTERDKKLLMLMAVVLLVVGLGYGVIKPLLSKNEELKTEIVQAQEEQMEKQQKVIALPTLQNNVKQTKEQLDTLAMKYYKVMSSVEIDKMLTEMAVAKGLTVQDLSISLPKAGEYTTLMDYPSMLSAKLQELTMNSSGSSGESVNSFLGIYTAQIQFSLAGNKDTLWDMLDGLMAQEPKLQMMEYLWQRQSSDAEDAESVLSMKFQLYMAEDQEQYRQEAIELQAQQEDSETETENETGLIE